MTYAGLTFAFAFSKGCVRPIRNAKNVRMHLRTVYTRTRPDTRKKFVTFLACPAFVLGELPVYETPGLITRTRWYVYSAR